MKRWKSGLEAPEWREESTLIYVGRHPESEL